MNEDFLCAWKINLTIWLPITFTKGSPYTTSKLYDLIWYWEGKANLQVNLHVCKDNIDLCSFFTLQRKQWYYTHMRKCKSNSIFKFDREIMYRTPMEDAWTITYLHIGWGDSFIYIRMLHLHLNLQTNFYYS